jgi:hypothetical protein
MEAQCENKCGECSQCKRYVAAYWSSRPFYRGRHVNTGQTWPGRANSKLAENDINGMSSAPELARPWSLDKCAFTETINGVVQYFAVDRETHESCVARAIARSEGKTEPQPVYYIRGTLEVSL